MILYITLEGNICADNQDGTNPIIYQSDEIFPTRIDCDIVCMSDYQLYHIIVTDSISITPILMNDNTIYKVNPNNFSDSFAIVDNCCYHIDRQTNMLVLPMSSSNVKINISNINDIKISAGDRNNKKRFLFVDTNKCIWLVCPNQGQIKITDCIYSDYINIFYECRDNNIIVYFFCSNVIVMQIFVKNLDTYIPSATYSTQLNFTAEKAFECNCPNNFRIISTEGNVYRCKNVSSQLSISTRFKIKQLKGFDAKIIEANTLDQIVYIDENHTIYEETGRNKIGTGFFTANINNNTKSARFY